MEPWAAVHVPYDADFVSGFKQRVHIRAFDPGSKIWYAPARYVPIVRDLAEKTIQLQLAAPPVFRGFELRATSAAAKIPEDYEILCVLPGSPLIVVKAAYRALALICHPDRGGDPAHFRTLTEAYERVSKEVR
jgi:hypothetical protein